MPKKFVDKLLKTKSDVGINDYVELDLSEYEGDLDTEPAELYVRVAELTNLSELPDLKKEVYDGNIVIADISLMKQDKLMVDRAITELKQVAADVRGDIAGLGEDQVIVSPMNVRIDRTKVVGGKY